MSDVCFCLKIQNFVRFRKKNNPYGFGGWYRKVCVKTTKTPGIWIPLVIKDFEMANGQSSLACLRKPPTSIFADSSGGECFGADRSLAKCEIHTLEKRAEGNIRCCPMPTYPSAFTLPPPPLAPLLPPHLQHSSNVGVSPKRHTRAGSSFSCAGGGRPPVISYEYHTVSSVL